MDIERRADTPSRGGLSLPARVALGGIAALGMVVLMQWVLAALLGVIRFALFVVIIVAAGAWVIGAKGNR